MKNNSQLTKITIVDDHKIFTEGLEQLINESGIACVIGKAHSAAKCLELLENELPELLLLDISMPGGSGIDLCRQVKMRYPQVKTLMLTSYSELTTIMAALDAGADGYVLKNSEPEEMLESICTVAAGGRFLCDEVEATLQKNNSNTMQFTRRELELLRLIAEGLTQSDLADRMCLSIYTIRSYRKTLNLKLCAHNTVQLLQNAKALHLL